MVAGDALALVMQDLEGKWHKATPQDHSKASSWPMPQRSDRTLEWNGSVRQIDRVCRAFGKFGSFAFFDNSWWWVYDLTVWQQVHKHPVGKVVHKSNTEMVVSASDGFVCLRMFEPLANWPG
jgi:methionyl-tRNA formyltransferase